MKIELNTIVSIAQIIMYVVIIILVLVVLWLLFGRKHGYYYHLVPLIDDIILSEKCKGHVPKTNIGGVLVDLLCDRRYGKDPYSRIGNIYNTIENMNNLLRLLTGSSSNDSNGNDQKYEPVYN